MKNITCVCFGLVLTAVLAKVRYDGYQVLRIIPTTSETLEFVRLLRDQFGNEVDFWKSPIKLGHPVDIMVRPHTRSALESMLEINGIPYSVHVEDVQSLINGQRMRLDSALVPVRDFDNSQLEFDYTKYHTLEQIMQWMSNITTENSNIVEELVVGQSFEGRDIKILKIGSQVSGKPAVYIQGGIHAREWISPATMLYIVKELVEAYGNNNDVTAMLNGFDWYIVPVLNVDGYSFSWTEDRMWRKNRNTNNDCVGVDLNRNYDYGWGGTGASSDPCHDTYRGESALSEPELKAITNFLLGLRETQPIHAHVDFHAYGQEWMYPWGYSTLVMPPEEDDMLNVAKLCTAALKAEYGTEYDVGGSARLMYSAGGVSEDWAYSRLGAKYTYSVELRDKGRYGFLLPENQILPTGIETFTAIKELGKNLVSKYVVYDL